ncbi:MAG: S49 family peptidase [Candidatus Hydrothermarchaeales archaeon]
MEILEKIKDAGTSPVFLVVVGVLIGYIFFVTLIKVPKVGVIEINGAIMEKETADKINEMLRYAGEERDIKTVVLEVNSPGGEASASEEIYLNVLKLRSKKPVVASINQIGASGAYYISVAADHIITKPGSNVGSIGVRVSLPRPERLDENTITTGPFKDMGSSREGYTRQGEEIKESFVRAVMTQRGDKLKMTKARLSQAEIFVGMDAIKLGLIDEIGSNEDAYDRGAELAGIRNYKLLNINDELGISLTQLPVFMVNESVLNETNTVPVHYFIYRNFG